MASKAVEWQKWWHVKWLVQGIYQYEELEGSCFCGQTKEEKGSEYWPAFMISIVEMIKNFIKIDL